jgi:hypothetical protein
MKSTPPFEGGVSPVKGMSRLSQRSRRSLMVGTNARNARELPVAELVETLVAEAG